MKKTRTDGSLADSQSPTVHAVTWRFRESSLSHNDLWFIQSGDGDGLTGRAAETFTEANARLIVTAVNHHHDLLEIARYVYDTLGTGAPLYNTAALRKRLSDVLGRIEDGQ